MQRSRQRDASSLTMVVELIFILLLRCGSALVLPVPAVGARPCLAVGLRVAVGLAPPQPLDRLPFGPAVVEAVELPRVAAEPGLMRCVLYILLLALMVGAVWALMVGAVWLQYGFAVKSS